MSGSPGRRIWPGRAVLAGAVALATIVAGLTAPGAAEPSAAAPTEPVRVILELDAPPTLAALTDPAIAPVRRTRATQQAAVQARTLVDSHTELLERARAEGISLDVVYHLTAAYNGLVVEVAPAQVSALTELSGVRAVHSDTSYAAALHHSVPLIGAPEVWRQTDPSGVPLTGAGTIVSILDTGIDYRHPDLGSGFGPGHKVVAGHDFVNNDADPIDDNGHGTHVAGIVAADGVVRGVAPDARLTAYKVLDRFGEGQLSDVIAGLDAAVDPANPYRADVVNMSLSGPGDGTDPLSVAADRAVSAGTVVVGAASNTGPAAQSVRSPAAADQVLAVGATASGVRVPRVRLVEPVERDLRAVRYEISADPPAEPRRMEIVDVDTGTPDDYERVDVTGKAVLVNLTTDPVTAALRAQEHGAAVALFYDADAWGNPPPVARPLQAASSGTAGGAAPERQLAADAFTTGIADDGRLDQLVVLYIPGASAAGVQRELANGAVAVELSSVDITDQLADFSARGPSGRFTAKPELTAPGVEVLSTLPASSHGRGTGTSMAAPHVAAAAALLSQLHPQWTPAQIGAALTTSAHRLAELSALEQGSGRLDLPAAADTRVLANPRAVSFGLAGTLDKRITRSRVVAFTNHGAEPVSLSFTVTQPGHDATVTVDPSAAELSPGGTVEVTVGLAMPTPAGELDLSGWLTVDGANDSPLSVPFQLSVRRLSVHVTPDPALVGNAATVYIYSPASLAAPPSLSVVCPGGRPHLIATESVNPQVWQASVPVDATGLCQVRASATTTAAYGGQRLAAVGKFEAVTPPEPGWTGDHWQPVGPNAQAGWLAFGASLDRVVVVSHRWPSIFVSDDRMQTWQETWSMPMSGGRTVDVEVHPHEPDRMVAAVNGGAGVDHSYAGRLLHTDDGGESWRILPRPDATITAIAWNATGSHLAVVDANGLRVTRDLGASWTEMSTTWSGVRDLDWVGSDLYLAANEGLLAIRDATRLTLSPPKVVYQPGVLGWAGRVAGDEQTLLVTSYPFPELYISHDGGESWELGLTANLPGFEALELVGDDIYALQPGNLWIGADRGAEWEPWGDPMPPAVEFDFATVAGEPDALYLASADAGVYSVNGPAEFDRVGLPGTDVLSLAVGRGPDGERLVAGTILDTFHTSPAGRGAIRPGDFDWSGGEEGTTRAEAPLLAASPSDPSIVYKVRREPSVFFGIWRSDDGGASWKVVARPDMEPIALLVHPADPDRVYVSYGLATFGGLVMTDDGGQTWRKVDHGRVFQALAGDPTDPDRIWAGDLDGLYLSEDGGMSFRRLAETPISAIAVNPDDPEHLVVGGRSLRISRDGGNTLQPADYLDLDMWVTDLKFGRASGQVFAATVGFFDELRVLHNGRGVLSSTDGGESWESFGHGLRNRNATSLALSGNGRHLYVGTLGGSVHRIALP